MAKYLGKTSLATLWSKIKSLTPDNISISGASLVTAINASATAIVNSVNQHKSINILWVNVNGNSQKVRYTTSYTLTGDILQLILWGDVSMQNSDTANHKFGNIGIMFTMNNINSTTKKFDYYNYIEGFTGKKITIS